MATGTKNMIKAIGLVLIVVGAGLAFWGYQLSDSVGSQLTEAITGSEPEEVMIRYIAGAASFVAGLYLFLKK
ncbi:MAG: DUF3185 family protein [Saccharospirillum sp.]|nr:DUF3185 family protein [Saccharospirillum sp.]